MSQPLTITFTVQQADNILERGALLTDVKTATDTFMAAMETGKHKAEYVVSEGVAEVKTRKPRTVHPVADAPAQDARVPVAQAELSAMAISDPPPTVHLAGTRHRNAAE
jgi:hypothetical protein